MDSIPQDQLENTVIIFVGDNGSPPQVAEEEPKTEIGEGGVRIPMIIADGASVAAEIAGAVAPPVFLSSTKLNRRTKKLAHVVDLYATIADIAGVTASLPAVTDSVSLWQFPSEPGNQSPARDYNFSQFYRSVVDLGATLRNSDYKLNYQVDPITGPLWTYYEYLQGEIPGIEDALSVDAADDIFAGALLDINIGNSNPAADNLDQLLDELIFSGNYQLDDAVTAWVDPR